MKRTKKQYTVPGTDVTLGYIEYLPEGYEAGGDYPLVLFLHGYGERGRGDDESLDVLEVHSLPYNAASGTEYPFVLIAPQCPLDAVWPVLTESLNRFLDHLLATYRVDADRVCLTGISMGGTETWLWASAYPARFACIAPVCGDAVHWMAFNMVNLPVWAFHGTLDNVISCTESISMVNEINTAGGHANLTLYPGVGHDSWVPAYAEPALFAWIMEQHR